MDTNLSSVMGELALLVQVVDGGSFSAAARRQDMTPSAVSRAIARLETTLSVQLLRRTTRQLALTEAGEAVYQQARLMVDAAGAACAVANAAQQAKGRLCIAAPRALGRHIVYPVAMAFADANPDVDLVLMFEDRPIDLIADRVDIAFTITDRPAAGLAGRMVMSVPQVICASPAYLQSHGLPREPVDLKEHNCICLSDGPEDRRWRFTKGQAVQTVRVTGQVTVNHSGLRLQQACEGRGIAVLPAFVCADALRNGQLHHVLPDWRLRTNFEGEAWALYRANRHMPRALSAFLAFWADR